MAHADRDTEQRQSDAERIELLERENARLRMALQVLHHDPDRVVVIQGPALVVVEPS